VEFTGDGKIRVLLVTGFTGRVRMVTSDYRKFRTSATIVSIQGSTSPNGTSEAEPHTGAPAPEPKP